MKIAIVTVAVVLAAGSLGYAADPAGDPLDGALGGKPALDPNAAAKNDNDDLTNDLTSGKKPDAAAAADPGKMMKDFIDNTKAAGKREIDEKDPGAETQDHQRRATVAMDGMIEYVKEQNKKKDPPPPKPGDPKPAEKKKQNPGQAEPGDPNGPHQDSGTDAAKNSELPGGGVNPFQDNGEMITKDPKEWGNLQQKDRDLMLQSLQDGSLKSYQEKIRKYYEALAEIGRGSK